ncbi:TNT domain-containing protein [Actinomadura graeca]|uniref:TNT domain-containing protein n=1 Tax=Actinomadura graeca TaxID=2750812 RepID=A0ABX8R6S0_9ACTN|nr:TNT domain-containing protein [Actinomadura graeca]
MARDYDTQLLESVAVRRRRLRDALLFGPQRTRRSFDENVGKIVAGLCLAAVLCAGTVGWSFLRSRLQEQKREQARQSQQGAVPEGAAAQVPADWVGSQVTFARLRAALTQAGVPSTLYVLPGQPRPPARRASSYYVVARGADQFTGGIVEFEQGRVAAQFPTEDEACRWLYGELAVKETPPHVLTPQGEQEALRQGTALAADARAKINLGGGAAVAYPLPQGRFVDQFGQESGSVLFPFGMPFAQRGLPPAARAGAVPGAPPGYLRYRVVKPFLVTASISAAAPRSPGGGVRFTVNAGLFPRPPALPTVRWLMRNGYLERVSGTAVPG